MNTRKRIVHLKTIFCLVTIIHLPFAVSAQEKKLTHYNRDTLITAAIEMIENIPYCALITLDSSGHPTARTMDPFTPEKNFIIWFGTNINSRKVKQIKEDPRVSIYYEAAGGIGYVMIKGNAKIVDDYVLEQKYWKKEWEKFYDNKKSNYVLIKVAPLRLEIVDYKNGIISNSQTWVAPFVEF